MPAEKYKIGILAFGSLIADPGEEIEQTLVTRIETKTPFPVEYGRYSGKTRGGAPTLVPYQRGASVAAQILVLKDAVPGNEARDMLWRRELRKTGGVEKYVVGTSSNSVLVRTITTHPSVETLLFTDFNPVGKIRQPTAGELADRAISSVAKAKPGMDGISYLAAAIKAGIETPLTKAYVAAILVKTQTESLLAALAKVRVLEAHTARILSRDTEGEEET